MWLIPSLLGCAQEPEPAPEQLEALTVDVSGGEDPYAAVEATGAAAVDGADADFTLTVGDVGFAVHSPGHSDLSALDGADVTAWASEAGLHEERTLLVRDANGVVYVGNEGWEHPEVTEAFGSGFATWGEELATARDDLYDWSYTTARFETDEGPVEVRPGETDRLLIGGATYRVAVTAAYRVTPRPNAALPCGGISDLLGYELLRVATDPTPEILFRPEGVELAHLGCL